MLYDVFISHSTKDGDQVSSVLAFLEGHGFKCFVASRDLSHSDQWQGQLSDSLEQSRILLYIHTKNSNQSSEVGREINYFADKCRRPIIVYRLCDAPYSRDRSYYLHSLNYIDSLGGEKDGFSQLLNDVDNALKGNILSKVFQPRQKKNLKYLWGSLAAVALICLFVGLARYRQSRIESLYAQRAASVQNISSSIDSFIVHRDSLAYVFHHIDSAEAIINDFSSKFGPKYSFAFDPGQRRERAISELEEIRSSCIDANASLNDPASVLEGELLDEAMALIEENNLKIRIIDSLLTTANL